MLIKETNDFDETNAENRELREAHEKSLNEMEELKRFKALHSIQFRGEKLVEDRDTVLDLTGKIQEI